MKSFYGMCSMIYFNILSCIRNVNISSLFLFLLDHYIVSWYTCSRLHLNNIRIRISIQDSSQNHLFIEYENSPSCNNTSNKEKNSHNHKNNLKVKLFSFPEIKLNERSIKTGVCCCDSIIQFD